MRRYSRLLPIVAVSAALLIGCGSDDKAQDRAGSATPSRPASSSADDEKAVREAFDAYKEALRQKDGESAVRYIASSIDDFYGEARDAALTASPEEVRKQGLTSQTTIYGMRASFSSEVLRNGSPEELLAEGVTAGLTGQAQNSAAVRLEAVQVDGDSASATPVINGRESASRYLFVREGGAWKLDLRHSLAEADQALTAQAKEQGKTVAEYVDAAIASIYGAEKARQLQAPIGK